MRASPLNFTATRLNMGLFTFSPAGMLMSVETKICGFLQTTDYEECTGTSKGSSFAPLVK